MNIINIKGLFDNFIRAELYHKNEHSFHQSILAPFVLKMQLFSLASVFVITDGMRETHESDKRRKGMMKTRKNKYVLELLEEKFFRGLFQSVRDNAEKVP
jgi:hypothetical protein